VLYLLYSYIFNRYAVIAYDNFPVNAFPGGAAAGPGGPLGIVEPSLTRQNFPETWLWTDSILGYFRCQIPFCPSSPGLLVISLFSLVRA